MQNDDQVVLFWQWVLERCPSRYILSGEGMTEIDLELKIYIDKFMRITEPTFEAFDAAVRGFESSVPPLAAANEYADFLAGLDVAEATKTTEKIKCDECGIPLRTSQARLVFGQQKAHRCDCCESMIESCGRRPGLVRAQAEYEQENARRAREKTRMMKS